MSTKTNQPTRTVTVEDQRRHWMSVLDFGVTGAAPATPARERPAPSAFVAMP